MTAHFTELRRLDGIIHAKRFPVWFLVTPQEFIIKGRPYCRADRSHFQPLRHHANKYVDERYSKQGSLKQTDLAQAEVKELDS